MAGAARAASLLLAALAIHAATAQDDIREPPKIIKPEYPTEMFGSAQEPKVEIECIAEGNPPPRYEWYFNNQPIIGNEYVKYSADSGMLSIPQLTKREEGFYNCRATNTFPNGMQAVAISAKVEVRMARVDDWLPNELTTTRYKTVTEGSYLSIKCGNTLPEYFGPVTFKWYLKEDETLNEIQPDERIFIDAQGTLHFSYALGSDEVKNHQYSCALSSSLAAAIKLGGNTDLTVEKQIPINEVKPTLHYQSKGDSLIFERNDQAQLECFFSGYVNVAGQETPTVEWYDNAGDLITNDRDPAKYLIEERGRTLQIMNLQEEDEKQYTCKGTNRVGEAEARLMLNVTSKPIWVPGGALKKVTVPQGKDARFKCEARSAAGEAPPEPPRWHKNGQRLDLSYDPNKYSFADDMRVMTVKSAQKSTDIACFQCYVDNSIGTVFGDGCLNVILPIEIIARPKLEQVVEQGDIVNLTVIATSDALYPPSYKWIFRNKTYLDPTLPPHVTYDENTKLTFINTTNLSEEEMKEIAGQWKRIAYHTFEDVEVSIDVRLKNAPIITPVAAAGFDYWIIGLIIGILLVVIIIFIICCVICRRKMKEGDYLVDRKETAAGLDPEKEIKDSGFHDLGRADYDYFPEKKSPALDFDDIPIGEGDDESFGSAEYGEEATAFNEDGSFIGVYSKGKKAANGPPAYQQQHTESNV